MWPATWAFFPNTESSPEDSVVLLSYNSSGVLACIVRGESGRPLGPIIALSHTETQSWIDGHAADFAAWHAFGQEDFGAWYPKDWVQDVETWLKPLDPQGHAWECFPLERGMDLYYRFPAGVPNHCVPTMGANAQRWLSPLSKRDAVRVHRQGHRLELAAIQQGRLLSHTVFQVETSQDAAYACMVLYDQCGLPAQHVPLIWEGDADEGCWESLRPFIEKLDTTASHPWSALTVLFPRT
ncbi:MAG: DUF3822 family protein [Flavobacteriia bacterium]|nr:DUF3822 family protein [Flavobacteriia bacterium]